MKTIGEILPREKGAQTHKMDNKKDGHCFERNSELEAVSVDLIKTEPTENHCEFDAHLMEIFMTFPKKSSATSVYLFFFLFCWVGGEFFFPPAFVYTNIVASHQAERFFS